MFSKENVTRIVYVLCTLIIAIGILIMLPLVQNTITEKLVSIRGGGIVDIEEYFGCSMQQLLSSFGLLFIFLAGSGIIVSKELIPSSIPKTKLGSNFNENIVCKILLLISFTVYCIIMALFVDNMLDNDLSSEMLLPKLLSEEKGVISRNWYYSTELRVLGNQLAFTPLFWIFKDWHTIRVIASAICWLVYIASFYYLCVQTNLKKKFPYLAIFLVLPLSSDYCQFSVLGLHYIQHTVIPFLFFALCFHLLKTENKKSKRILQASLVLLSFLAGLGGVRQVFNLYIPSLIAAIFMFVKDRSEKPKKFLVYVSLSFIASVIGLMLYEALIMLNILRVKPMLGDSYIFPSFSAMLTILLNFVEFFGWKQGLIFSFASAANLICVIVITTVVIGTVRSVSKDNSDFESKVIAVYFIFAIAIYLLLYFCTDRTFSGRFTIPIAVFGIPCIGFAFAKTYIDKRIVNIFCKIILLGVICCGTNNFIKTLGTDKTANYREIVNILEENNSTNGYSLSFDANILTELSSGKIETWIISSNDLPEVNFSDIHKWLQRRSHEKTKPEGKVFVFYNDEGYVDAQKEFCDALNFLDKEKIVYDKDGYTVWIYDNYESLMQAHMDVKK